MRKIIIGDMFLNYFLGLSLILFPSYVQQLILSETLIPNYVYQIIGLGLVLFATWQRFTLKKKKFSKKDYMFASIMALWPFVAFTIVLVLYNSSIFLIPKILMWIGNIYMLVLGIAYWKKGKKD